MSKLHPSVTSPLSIYPMPFKLPYMNRLTPVPARDALVYNLPDKEHANGQNSANPQESKDDHSHHLYVFQQPPLEQEWAREWCELYDLLPISIQLQHRFDGFPNLEAMDDACKAYEALVNGRLRSGIPESKTKLLNPSVKAFLFRSDVCLDIDGIWAASLRDYRRLRTRDNDYYTRTCLNSSPRVPGSIFGTQCNSLHNILEFLKLRRTKNSQAEASMVGIANHLITMVALQAWHVVNGRYLLYSPAASIQEQKQQQGGEAKQPSSASVLFDHSKPPMLMMSFRQRDFVLHDIVVDLIRSLLAKQSGTPAESAGSFDIGSLVVEEGDLQAIAARTSLGTFIFLVMRCVARIAATQPYGLGHMFSLQDSLKFCRDQMRKNVVLFLDTLHFREMPVKDTVELFNQLTRYSRGDKNVDNRLLGFRPGRWCRARTNASISIKPMAFPDKISSNPYATHVPQFFYHLFNSPTAPVLPAPPSDDRAALMGTVLWALALHTGTVMRTHVLKHVRDKAESKSAAAAEDGDGEEDEEQEEVDEDQESERKVASNPRRGAKRKGAKDKTVQNKRRRAGTKQSGESLFITRKARPVSLLSSVFGKFRPALSPIRRRYCFVLGPGDVLYASPPATFFVDDPVNDGLYVDEASVLHLTTPIINCLLLQGTDQSHLMREAFAKSLTDEGRATNPPHYTKLFASLQSLDNSVMYKVYLALSSVIHYEADVIASLKAFLDPKMPELLSADNLRTALVFSYEAYVEEVQKAVEAQDKALGGIYNTLHDLMRTSWSRVAHVPFSALRSANQPASSGLGFGVLKLDAMEKLVADIKNDRKIAFVNVEPDDSKAPESMRVTPRDDVSAQLAMALVNRHPPPASELKDAYVTDLFNSGAEGGITSCPAMEFFDAILLRTHRDVVVPCLLYVSIKCPAPVIMHNSTSATKIAYGTLPAPKVRSATESAMLELATKHTAAFASLITSPSFINDVHAMVDVPDKLKPALQFLFLSAPASAHTPTMFRDVGRLMGNFGRSPADIAQQQMAVEGGLANSAQQVTRGHIKHATVGSRELSFFTTAPDSKYQPVRPDVMFDGSQLYKLCQQSAETVAFWQVLQSFIGSMMDTHVLRNTGGLMYSNPPRVISLTVIEAGYLKLASDVDCPIGYTLRPPGDRLMDVLQFLWLSIVDSSCRILFIRILVDTANAAKQSAQVSNSPDLQVFFLRLKAKVNQFESAPRASNNSSNSNAQQMRSLGQTLQPQPQPASTSLVHERLLLQPTASASQNSNNSTSSNNSAAPVPMDVLLAMAAVPMQTQPDTVADNDNGNGNNNSGAQMLSPDEDPRYDDLR